MTSSASDDLLRRLLTGEIDADDPRVREAAASDPEFARAASEAREVQAQLDEAARVRALDLARAAELRDATSDARVRAFVLERVNASRRARWRWRAFAVACAAAVVLAVFLGPWSRRTDSTTDPVLGAAGIELIEPREAGADFRRFRWSAKVSTGWFVVKVEDAQGEDLPGSDPIEVGTVWEPDPSVIADWPDEIRWGVEWWDSSGTRKDWVETWASR